MVSSRLAFLARKDFCNDTLSHHHPELATPTKVSAYLERRQVVWFHRQRDFSRGAVNEKVREVRLLTAGGLGVVIA